MATSGPHAAGRSEVEIRLLGALQVRRADGSTVDPREWRTGKTADLLRLLALRAGRPVDPQLLLDTLWPTVERGRARASLRTAASQIRHVLGPDVLERTPSGLQLHRAWVDVLDFRALVGRVRDLVDRRDWARVAPLARRADMLYRGDLSSADPHADWALAERRALADCQQVLLVDAAEAACHRGRPREAIELATRALLCDPFDERATRLSIQAHLDLGQLPSALREYHRCRNLLADELGVDPSPQTTALYLAALRCEPALAAVAV